MYRLVDTHAHLEEIPNLSEALRAARDAGITAIVAVGSDLDSNQRVLQIAESYPGLVCPALGLHPWHIPGVAVERTLTFIEDNIGRAVAVGEIGLDYHKRVRAATEKDRQQGVLRELLGIAARHHKPVSLHTRYAWADTLRLVAEARLEKAVFHWYTGTTSVLREIINLGYYISSTPAVAYHEEHRRAVREVPLERLLLETDCPVVYGRGRDFEFEARPADLLRSLRGSAEARGQDEAEIAAATTANARRLFGLE